MDKIVYFVNAFSYVCLLSLFKSCGKLLKNIPFVWKYKKIDFE